MEITPRELRDIEIHSAVRGYDRDEVNDLLERAAATIDAANERVSQLSDRLNSAQSEAGRTRETEDILHRTLLLAQRAADEAVAEATAKSRQMLDDAEIQSRRLVADAEADARRKGESERRRLEEEILDLASRRDTLLADVEAMTRFEAEYRERMVHALEADLFALRSRPTSAPGSRPEPTEVELPQPVEAIVTTGTAVAEKAEPVDVTGITDAGTPGAPSAAVPAASATTPASEDLAPSTHEIDVRSLFGDASEGSLRDLPTPGVSSASSPAPAAPRPPVPPVASVPQAAAVSSGAPTPVDLLGNDGVEADVLDDDAFFATLRDAVHDEAPLGPRDEHDGTGENSFFDQDADRGSFRDVFRRRR